jgi:hypothetical protein
MPAGARLADRGEVRSRVIWVPYCHHARVDVGCQRVDRVEDRLRYAAGLVNDHQHIAGVDALESSRVVVSRLAAVRDELVADVPLGIECYAPGQIRLPVSIAHVAPKDRFDLRSGRGGRDHEGLAWWMHIDPPKRQPRHRVRLRNVVRCLECAVAVLDYRLRHAVLARPPELAQGRSDPSHGIAYVRVLRRIEQICENRPFGSPSHAAPVCLKPNKEDVSVMVQGFSG